MLATDQVSMRRLLILPAILTFAFTLAACNDKDDPPADPGPVVTVVPSEVPTTMPTVVPSSGTPSISLKPTTTTAPSIVPVNPSCGPEDNDCGNGADKAGDGK